MTGAQFATAASPPPRAAAADRREYRAGVCNIGPEEIARRRRAGHMGVVVTAIVLAGLLILQAPAIVRLVLIVPAAGAAIGYLQAVLRFCAGFASRGVFNFGGLGRTTQIVDPESRARDHARALQIALASLAIGVVVGLVAVALPV